MTAEIIPFKPPTPTEPRCSFCGKPKSPERQLIATADRKHSICFECVEHATKRLEEVTHDVG